MFNFATSSLTTKIAMLNTKMMLGKSLLLFEFEIKKLEINKIEINDKTLQLPIPSITGNLRPQTKLEKIFLQCHIL